VRQKLAKGLKAWHPSDQSALQMLMPWRGAFAPGVMQTFLGMNIVPKLERALQAITLQTTEQFACLELFGWMELLGPDVVCQMLVKFFFPRLYESIYARLSVPAVVLMEVQAYYKAWKDLMPPALLQMGPIREEMTKALMAMHQVQRGNALPPLRVPQYPPAAVPVRPQASAQPHPPDNFTLPSGPTSFRQLVEQRASRQGILFVPQMNKFQDGKQIYTLGIRSICFDGTVIFLLDSTRRQWKPIGLETLMTSCQ